MNHFLLQKSLNFRVFNVFVLDMVAVLGETTGLMAAKQIKERMMNDPEGASILKYVILISWNIGL